MASEECSILVIGFDSYKDCWPQFDWSFSRYLHGAASKTFFVSGFENYVSNCGIQNIKAGDLSFSSRLSAGLKEIQTSYVFLLLEDFLPCHGIQASDLSSVIQMMKEKNVSFCQMDLVVSRPRPRPARLGPIKLTFGNHYRLNLEPGIWKTDALLGLLSFASYSTPADFEVKINASTSLISGQLRHNLHSFINLIEKGKVTFYGQQFLIKNQLPVPPRDVLTKKETDRSIFRNACSSHAPSFLRKAIKRHRRKNGSTFYSDN